MRRILIMLLSFSFVFGLAACEEEDPVCSADQELVQGECVNKEPIFCAPGFIEEDGECVEEVIEYQGSVVRVLQNFLIVNDEKFLIKGIAWNPVPLGGTGGFVDFAGTVEEDAALMAAAGINVVRTYTPITSTSVLDTLYEHGIYVINSVYNNGNTSATTALSVVNQVKDHPAILMWSIGNEWNYNGLYQGFTLSESIEKLNEVAALIKANDENHPIATIYGDLPTTSTVSAMPDVDIWGLNVYRGADFGNLFAEWNARSTKPMFIAEYGADAWNSNINAVDETSQAYATRVLTEAILANSSFNDSSKRCLGAVLFSFNDEWWKDSNGTNDVQDVGGGAPGFGPYPDFVFNEEYWGIVDIYRNPREAYFVIQDLFLDEE